MRADKPRATEKLSAKHELHFNNKKTCYTFLSRIRRVFLLDKILIEYLSTLNTMNNE